MAEQVAQEYQDRKRRRADKEKIWKEIDRQVAMDGLRAVKRDGGPPEWFPCIELPSQANTVEVLTADTRRLMFPQTTDWYTAVAYLSDEDMEKLSRTSLIAGVKEDVGGGKIDQDTGNLIVHAVLDHFHSQYDFRGVWDRLNIEAIKYGTFAGRCGAISVDKVSDDFRSVNTGSIPMLFPCSIKNTYLDDSKQHVFHEGIEISPLWIREYWRRLKDLKMDPGKGWMNLESLDEEKNGHVHLVEAEGDFVIERTRGEDMYVPSVRIVVALQNTAKLIRWLPMETPFRTYVSGVYMPEDVDCPYGTSPLMKGKPLQEAASFLTNRIMAVGALQAEPPSAWDSQDTSLHAAGGPDFSPGASFKSDRPVDITVYEFGDTSALFAALQGLMEWYEQTTQVNDPRRGAGVKSHTTAYASDIALSRGLLRTEDYVDSTEQGAIRDWLYKEYWYAKRLLKEEPILLKSRGTEGFIELKGNMLPQRAEFLVHGSKGVINKREKRDAVIAWTSLVANLAPLLAQEGSPPELKALIIEAGKEYDIIDAERFFAKQSQNVPPGTSAGAALSELAQGAAGSPPEDIS